MRLRANPFHSYILKQQKSNCQFLYFKEMRRQRTSHDLSDKG